MLRRPLLVVRSWFLLRNVRAGSAALDGVPLCASDNTLPFELIQQSGDVPQELAVVSGTRGYVRDLVRNRAPGAEQCVRRAAVLLDRRADRRKFRLALLPPWPLES